VIEDFLSMEQLRELIKEKHLVTADEVQNMLKKMFAETLQEMMEAKLDTELGYPKNGSSPEGGSNRRNAKLFNLLSYFSAENVTDYEEVFLFIYIKMSKTVFPKRDRTWTITFSLFAVISGLHKDQMKTKTKSKAPVLNVSHHKIR
jgi:hypothetical protein